MIGFILGEKKNMEQMFDEGGRRIVTTHITTTPCFLVDVKNNSDKNYFAVKLGFGATKHIKKPQLGQLKKAGIKTPLRFLKEIRFNQEINLIEKEGKKGIKIGEEELFVGGPINPAIFFKKNDVVSVTGISKGKGFQGVVRRHGFAGGPRTHGQSDRERAPGSIGQSTTPGRVYKGKRMAGRVGQDKITVKNLKVVEATSDYLILNGLIPGRRGSLVIIKS